MEDTGALGDARKVVQGESLTPITTALDGNEHILFQGFSSLTGNYWLGGLAVYKPKKSPNSLGQLINEYDSDILDDLSERYLTHTTFDASVASIVSLNSSSYGNSNAVLVGLDDGSIQLVTMPDVKSILTSPKSSPKALTCNSATYHDWPIRKVTCPKIQDQTQCFVSLDMSGTLKMWDSNRLTPTVSWSIASSNWPQSGQALQPDLTILSDHMDSASDHVVMATLNPLDSSRRLAVWDTRVDTLTEPRIQQSSPLMGLDGDVRVNPPTSITSLSAHHLVLGTFDGFVHLFDIRQLAQKLATTQAFPDLEGSRKTKSPIRKVCQLLTQKCPSTNTLYLAAIGLGGEVTVFEARNSTIEPIYHSQHFASINETLAEPVGTFLPPVENHPWRLITTSGSPDQPSKKQQSNRTEVQLHPGRVRRLPEGMVTWAHYLQFRNLNSFWDP